jgi:hypothetical protein
MENVAIYGFGSFFNNNPEFQDIDILILHQSTSYESCQFSIWCKKYLLANVISADVTMLSKSEENQFSFIEKSKARYLGNVYEQSAKDDFDIILVKEFGNQSIKKAF